MKQIIGYLECRQIMGTEAKLRGLGVASNVQIYMLLLCKIIKWKCTQNRKKVRDLTPLQIFIHF